MHADSPATPGAGAAQHPAYARGLTTGFDPSPMGTPQPPTAGGGSAPAAQQASPVAGVAARQPLAAASFVTGAYQLSGDPVVDRMLQLELALKRHAR